MILNALQLSFSSTLQYVFPHFNLCWCLMRHLISWKKLRAGMREGGREMKGFNAVCKTKQAGNQSIPKHLNFSPSPSYQPFKVLGASAGLGPCANRTSFVAILCVSSPREMQRVMTQERAFTVVAPWLWNVFPREPEGGKPDILTSCFGHQVKIMFIHPGLGSLISWTCF